MRKEICFVLVFAFMSAILLAAGTSTVSSSASSIGTFYISNQSLYSPYPVEPGKYMDLWIRVQYRGEKTRADNVTCMIEARFPFSFDTGDSPEQVIGAMSPYDEVILKYRLRVDEKAVQGDNILVFKCKSAQTDWFNTELSFYIQSHNAVLSIENVETVPEKFDRGQEGRVNFYIKNLADSTIKDISLKFDLSGSDISFAPVNSTTEKRIAELSSGSSATLSFNIIAFQDAIVKTYKVPVTLTYSDNLGRSYTKSTIAALTVQSEKPEIIAVHEQTTYIRDETKNTVSISIINKGDAQAKFLAVELQSSDGYHVLSPNEMYVSSINSDDSDTVEYDLFINSSLPQIQMPLLITYSDVDGNSYSVQRTVEVKVFSKEAAVSFGIDKVIASDPIVQGVILVIGLYVLYGAIKFVFRKKAKPQ